MIPRQEQSGFIIIVEDIETRGHNLKVEESYGIFNQSTRAADCYYLS